MADEPNTEFLNPFPDRDGSRTDREARIRQRAFDLWQAEGMPEGREHEHWLAAEREVLMAEAEPSLGVPLVPGEDIPAIRGRDGPSADRDDAPEAPNMAGAPEPGPDTSKSPTANRDLEGPRKASMTPRPTRKPLAGG